MKRRDVNRQSPQMIFISSSQVIRDQGVAAQLRSRRYRTASPFFRAGSNFQVFAPLSSIMSAIRRGFEMSRTRSTRPPSEIRSSIVFTSRTSDNRGGGNDASIMAGGVTSGSAPE